LDILTITQDDRSSSAIQAKRQRLTPLRDITHISESTKNSQSQIDELKIALRKAQQEATEERKARMVADDSAAYSRDRSKEIIQSLGDLQSRYEKRMKQVHELGHEKQRILTEREADNQRREKLQADNIALKDQRIVLQEELRTARDALLASTNPSIAELESARSTARNATEEAHRLQATITNLRRDFEFTRSQYQDASTKAAEFASQVSDLEAQNAELKRQASDERRKLAELNYKEDRKRDLARIEALERELGNREAVLRRAEEENKALRKGRGVTTRGSSVQPGGGGAGGLGGNGSPRTVGGGSRAGSPALGALVGMGVGAGGGVANAYGPVGGRASVLRNER
jgi:chromosome segregation ATPase